MRTSRLATVLALAAAVLVCEPAAATFPGRNGEIVLSFQAGSKYAMQHMSLLRYAPRLGRPRQSPVCNVQASESSFRCSYVGRTAFTPDGVRIGAVVAEGSSLNGNPWALWTLSANGQVIDRVPLSTAYWDVRWAPDESALLAVRSLDPADLAPAPGRRTGVFVLNRDGSERSLLAMDATGADWCADGRVVVAQHGEIWALDLTRPGASRRLTRRGGAEPSCSPDSAQVAFTRGNSIWRIPTGGGRARRLTLGYAPVWSPDGKQIAYLRRVRRGPDPGTLLYRVGLRRLVVRRVSSDYVMTDDAYSDARAEDPDWQPLPAG